MADRSGNQAAESADSAEPFYVVGIGASAGGLGALKKLFRQVPKNPGMAFVVVVHLSPEHESHLTQLLQPHCPMPVQQVNETVALEPNRVYVIPPNANLNTIDTHLRLSELESARGERAPIDHFLRTLAETHGERAIGIVLTGTGSDGTLGLRQIKVHGGLTIAQDPQESEYDGMPRSAIASGAVDMVLRLDAVLEGVMRFAQTTPRVPVAEAEVEQFESTNGERIMQKLFTLVRSVSGRDFSSYKRATIMRRIRRRMQLHQVEELGDYLDLLRQRRDEAKSLADDLLITVTEFFRDPECFKELEKKVVPRLFEGKGMKDQVRVWTVGCSSGEEAYSLAFLLLEEAARRAKAPRVQVFASDLHDGMLKTARAGIYPDSIQTELSPERLQRFFTKEYSSYRIRRSVRELVTFAAHDMLRDPPFAHVDLISCRNFMIYLQRDAQEDLIGIFHYALNPDGYLMLGVSETIDHSDLFVIESKRHCLYRRRNIPNRGSRGLVLARNVSGRLTEEQAAPRAERPVSYGALHEKMVERYAPPSLLVNDHHEVVHYSSQAGRYLQIPGGQPTNNAIKLVREPLRIELRAALHAAQDSGAIVSSRPLALDVDGESRQVVLRVRAAENPELGGFFVVFFDELGRPGEAEAESETHRAADATLRELEAALDMTKKRLQTAIEEHEVVQEEMQASVEELQSANEELRTTMEELETSKEELQSTNEELMTANQENRHRVEELRQLTADLQNLMAATNIATLFLDRELRILRFTPQVTELFNVRAADRGRPLSDLTHRLGKNELHQDARNVLDRLVPMDRELQDEAGRWFLTRVLPYRTSEDRIDGVVITFIDITKRQWAEQSLREREEQLRVLVETSAVMVWETNAKGLIETESASWRAHTGQKGEEAMGEGWLQAVHPDDRERVSREWKEAVSSRTPLNNEFRVWHVDGSWRWTNARAAPVLNEDGSPRKWVGMNIDMTKGKQAEEALQELNRTLEQQVIERTAVAERRAEDLRRLAIQLGQAEHQERQRLAKLLHDDLQQVLVALKMRLPALVEGDPSHIPQHLEKLDSLVSECLTTSRNLTKELSPPVLQIGTLFDVVEWLAQWWGEKHSLKVTVETAGELPPTPEAIRVFFLHAIRELLTNVIKHSGKTEARISLGADDQQLVVQVEDEGEQFDPQSVGESLRRREGFGLLNLRERLDALGGKLDIQRTPRGGGCFRLIIPMAEVTAQQVEVAVRGKREAAASRRSKPQADVDAVRLLVVDDHAVVREGLVNILGDQPGLEVVGEAADGEEAIRQAEALRPDAILMDIDMPGVDGVVATRQIKQRQPEIVVVALSFHEDEAVAHAMSQAGATVYLSKTTPAAELTRAVRRACGRETDAR